MHKISTEMEFHENGVIVRYFGVVTNEELIQAKRDIYGHQYQQSLQFQLAELTGVTDFQVSIDIMRLIGTLDRANSRRVQSQHLAVAAPPGSPIHTLLSVWEVWAMDRVSNQTSIKIVPSLQEALAWLKDRGLAVIPKCQAR